MQAARKGARSRAAIPPATLAALNEGRIAAATLSESLAVDHALLLSAAVPSLPEGALAEARGMNGTGITRRMAAVADLLLRHAPDTIPALAAHPSDTVRGWAAFAVGRAAGAELAARLSAIRPFADDPHFGVREWAWLALRPHIAADPTGAIRLLEPWTREASANLRRFAVEATRPRGVWAAHIAALRQNPSLGLTLLAPLRTDASTYVQDSVANWINDAAKDRRDWARGLCAAWLERSPAPATIRICRRAMRSL